MSKFIVALRIDSDLSGHDAASLPCDSVIHMVWLLAEVQKFIDQVPLGGGTGDGWGMSRALLLQIANPRLDGPLSSALATHFTNNGGCLARLILAIMDGKELKFKEFKGRENQDEEEGMLITLPLRPETWPPVESAPVAKIGDFVEARIVGDGFVRGMYAEDNPDGTIKVYALTRDCSCEGSPTVISDDDLNDAERALYLQYGEGK